MIGTTIGVLMGHTLLPLIVHNTYATKVELPMIRLSFYPKITIIAFVLGFISAVVPAYLVAKKELKAIINLGLLITAFIAKTSCERFKDIP